MGHKAVYWGPSGVLGGPPKPEHGQKMLKIIWLAGCLGLRPGWLSGLQTWLDGSEEGDKQINKQRNRKSPHSTGLCPQWGPLPKKWKRRKKKRNREKMKEMKKNRKKQKRGKEREGKERRENCTKILNTKKWRILLNFVEFCWIPLNFFESAVFEKRVTHGRTDGQTYGQTD